MPAQREPGADAAGGVVATLGLPDGPALTVRTVTETDVEGLDALFHGLSDDDRHHRSFSLRHPARKFLEQMTRAEDEGGYRLVAVVSGAGDALVAEAGYAILPDGDGESALTVAPGRRGWRLGRYLLGAIVAAAAARGVPNLQADIMLGNARMLALVATVATYLSTATSFGHPDRHRCRSACPPATTSGHSCVLRVDGVKTER